MSAPVPVDDGTATPGVSTESHSSMVIIVTAVLTGASTVIFGLRLFTRTCLLKTAGLDDWTMLVAQILAITTGIATILDAHSGLGRHIQSLSAGSIRDSLVYLYLTISAYNLGLNVVKISFLLQYRRIFPNPNLRRVCLWMLGFVVIWALAQQILLSISCIPLAKLQPDTASWCLNTLPIWVFTSTVSLVTDVMIFLIPIPSIWELPIPMRQKSVLFGIFGLGFFVCVISIIRVPTLRAAASAEDPTWDNIGAALWTVAEYNSAIICSSLPVLRPLFFKATARMTSGKKSSTSGADLVESSGYKMQDMKSNKTTTRIKELGPTDSSEDLVTATYDEMMYGTRSRQSLGNGLRNVESRTPNHDFIERG